MASKEPEMPDHALISLIYLHLKKHGHKKAANVLKKHAPQVETKSVKTPLNDIFKKWLSEQSEKGSVLHSSPKKHAGGNARLSSSESAEPKQKKPRNMKNNASSGKKDKVQITAAAGNQKKKIPPKKEGKSSVPEPASVGSTVEDDSDSDSSLDVEKWKKLAFELSEADMAKMDALTNSNTTTKKGKPAKIQKDRVKKINASPSSRKTKVKTTVGASKASKTEKPLKSRARITSSKQKNKDNNLAETVVETPANVMASSHSEQLVIPRTEGISENVSNQTPSKKTKHKSKHSQRESNNTDTALKCIEKGNVSELAETPSKKGKSNKSVRFLDDLDVITPVEVADNHVGTNKLLFDQSDTHEDDLGPKRIESPPKKAKSKKSVEVAEPVDHNSQLTKSDIDVNNRHLVSDQLQTSSKRDKDVPAQSEISLKKSKNKKAKGLVSMSSPSEECETENVNNHLKLHQAAYPSEKTVTKKSKCAVESDGTKRSAKTKANTTDNIPEPSSFTSPSEEMEQDSANALSDACSKKSSETFGLTCNSLIETLPAETPSKKHKKKRKKQAECDGNGILSDQNVASGETSSTSTQSQDADNSENTEENQTLSAVEDGPVEPKKRKKEKKKNKEKDEYVAEEIPPAPLLEEFVDVLPSSQENKKKKKKKKYREEEEPPILTPAPEVETPKKKKKSSKGKDLINDGAQEGL
ncbi:nucleolar protein dao-5 [Hoplias malabaricus]|uniref:nucleolar protein dao-5 n=1 Tax=Hoplias malabaricus TaxID=27720 RepID=UPI003462FB02